MVQVTITESNPSPNPQTVLIEALAAELQRQGVRLGRRRDEVSVAGEIDLRGLAHAALHALSTTLV